MPVALRVTDRVDVFHMMPTFMAGRYDPTRQIAPRACAVGRVVPPVWLGRVLLLSALFVLMAICHGALLPAPAMAAAAQEHLPVHTLDCAVDIEAAAPFPATAKFVSSAYPATDIVVIASTVQAVVWSPDAYPVDPPAVRRARLQVFLI